jgi:indole-3-glycerol phosphate synthase
VSESGISRPETIRELREAGFRGFLIGETFMKTPEPGAALRAFIGQINSI